MKTSVLLGVAALTMAHAQGQVVTSTLNSSSPYLTVQGDFNGSTNYVGEWSGKLHFSQFDAFCGEPGQGIYFGETVTYNVVAPGSVPNFDLLSRIVGGYLASPQDATNAAAAQWAIWEVVTDGASSPSFSTGQVRIKPTGAPQDVVAPLALSYITNAGSYAHAPITFLTNPTRQDMIAITNIPGLVIVPETSSALLVGLGVLGLLRRRR